MTLQSRKLVHWIAALSIAMSALAPAVSQAVSYAKGGQGFSMEVCSADGSKMLQVQQDESTPSDEHSQPCPYCIAHASIPPAFNANLTFRAPQSLAPLPQLYYQSPEPVFSWLSPPSAAPPAKA